jgi:hypothetical protein
LLRNDYLVGDEAFAGVTKAFELRHVLAHEIAPAVQPSVEEAEACVMWCFRLIVATEQHFKSVLSADRRPTRRSSGRAKARRDDVSECHGQ